MTKSVVVIGTRGYPSYYGGFETAIRKLAPYLADEQWDVTVYGRKASTRAKEADPRIRTVETRGIETKSLSTLTYGLTSVLHTVRIKPQVALVMNVANGFWLPILKAAGVPTVVNVDGIEWDRQKWGRLAKFVFKTGAKMTARYADALIADSKEIRRRWNDEFGVDSHFIPYGGDVPEALSIPPYLRHRGYILFVARFVPENTTSEFFEAASLLASKYPIVIVGSSGYGGDLEETARRLDSANANVHWMGHVSDDKILHGLWQHAGTYFHGHSVGGTNPALVQAMACGAPTVARDTVYNREVLGDAAVFTDPSATSIVAACTEMMESPTQRESLAREAFRRSRERYSWDSVCERYGEILTKIMST